MSKRKEKDGIGMGWEVQMKEVTNAFTRDEMRDELCEEKARERGSIWKYIETQKRKMIDKGET